MNFSGINFCDTGNGPGCRVSLFVSGCTNNCKGCFSKNTWDFESGELFTRKQMKEILDRSEPKFIRGLSILGGEPLHPKNSEEVLKIVKEYRDRFGETKDVWIWTGYEFDHLRYPINAYDQCMIDEGLDLKEEFYKAGYKDYPLCDATKELLGLRCVFVCGRFNEDEKDLTLPYRGSRNQYLVFTDKGNYRWAYKNDDIEEKIKEMGLG